MSGFDSDNFRKKPTGPARTLREFNVGDDDSFDVPDRLEDLSPAELEKAVKDARKDKIASMTKIGEQAKKRIEILANIGRLTKDIPVDGGIVFSIRTLKAKETREAALATFTATTQIEAGFEARKQQLARSIYQIDGKELAFVLGNDDLETRLSFIEEMEENLVDKLFNEFSALKDNAKKQFSISTEAEAKEVAEDLKK